MSSVCSLQYVTYPKKKVCSMLIHRLQSLCVLQNSQYGYALFGTMKSVFLLSALLYLELINLVHNFSRPSHNKVMRNPQQLWQWPQPKPKPKPKRNPSNLLQFLRAIMGVTTDLARQFMHCFAMCKLFFLTSWSLFIQT